METGLPSDSVKCRPPVTLCTCPNTFTCYAYQKSTFKKIPDSNLYGVREKTMMKSILNKLINNVYTLQKSQPQQSSSPLYIDIHLFLWTHFWRDVVWYKLSFSVGCYFSVRCYHFLKVYLLPFIPILRPLHFLMAFH